MPVNINGITTRLSGNAQKHFITNNCQWYKGNSEYSGYYLNRSFPILDKQIFHFLQKEMKQPHSFRMHWSPIRKPPNKKQLRSITYADPGNGFNGINDIIKSMTLNFATPSTVSRSVGYKAEVYPHASHDVPSIPIGKQMLCNMYMLLSKLRIGGIAMRLENSISETTGHRKT